MFDTLKLLSPPISKELADRVERSLRTYCGIQNSTKEILYAVVSGSLSGTWDSSVSCRVFPPAVGGAPGRVDGYCVVIEGSVHKAMMGHNVDGGPERLVEACAWFVKDVGNRLSVKFPPGRLWGVMRMDWTEVYDLGSFDAVRQYLIAMGLARYARRQAMTYAGETVAFAGSTTMLKLYHKGPEFATHDRRRLEKFTNSRYAFEVQERANRYLRVELSIKGKKLKSEYGDYPEPERVSLEWVRELHDLEVGRVLREGKSDMDWVRKNDEVSARLADLYGRRLGGVLYGTWLKFATQGEEKVRSSMARATFYLHRKQLSDAHVAWEGTDVYIDEDLYSAIPAGFRPVRSDPRRVSGESVTVKEALLATA